MCRSKPWLLHWNERLTEDWPSAVIIYQAPFLGDLPVFSSTRHGPLRLGNPFYPPCQQIFVEGYDSTQNCPTPLCILNMFISTCVYNYICSQHPETTEELLISHEDPFMFFADVNSKASNLNRTPGPPRSKKRTDAGVNIRS